jgi:hypothetical protein
VAARLDRFWSGPFGSTVQSTLPASVRTPAEQVIRLILKTAMLNQADPELLPSPAMPRIGVKRVLPPYLGEMGYEVKYHLARVEPWLNNGWKILARRPEFYPAETAIEAPEFFAACDAIMSEMVVIGAGAGIYAPPSRVADLNIAPRLEGQGIELQLQLTDLNKASREAAAEIRLRQLFLDWLDYDGRPLTDYDRNIFCFTETCVAETEIRRAEALRPSYLPPAFLDPPEATPPHVGLQMRAVKLIDLKRNSDPDWMVATAQAMGAHLGLPVIAYGRPDGCVIPEGVRATWRDEDGGRGHLARELGYLKSCRIMLGPDSGWTDLMAWLGVPVLLEMLPVPNAFEGLRDSFQPRIALVDRAAPIGPQVNALLAAEHCLPTTDPRKGGLAKALFPWEY